MGPFANNGSLPTRGVGWLPGPLSDQLWCKLKNAETPAMVLTEGEFPLTWFLTTALLSKRETRLVVTTHGQMTLLKECSIILAVPECTANIAILLYW